MVRAIGLVLAGVALTGAASLAAAGEIDRAPLRGSSVYGEPPSYPVGIDVAAYDRGVAPPARAPVPDVVAPVAPAPRAFTFEVGGRYWVSSGTLGKTLFDLPANGTSPVSRLTYRGLSAQTGEVFARIDNAATGVFVKGYAGLGSLGKGGLNDEDFPPGIDPYSSTLSDQRGGSLSYLSADLGYGLVSAPRYRVGAFVGYHYLAEQVNAFGCSQVATNPFVCAPAIAGTVQAISEDAKWNAVRLGISADVKVTGRLSLAVEAAWIPYATLKAADTHWLRLGSDFSGPIPEPGTGSGAQLEASLSYRFTDAFSVGVGARYWRMESHGNANFGAVVPGAGPQPVSFITERAGAYVQGAYRFGVM